MSKRKTERLFEEIRRMAEQLGGDNSALSQEEIRNELRETGIDPEDLKARLHAAAKRLAEREIQSNRMVPLYLKQAFDATRPGDQLPSDPAAAYAFVDRWLDRFRSVVVLPADLAVARAYRKSGDLSETEQLDLDQLEEELKEKVKKENEQET
jgi:hypothetical protein